jgi:hydrogenase-4 membrane subunit HyfE
VPKSKVRKKPATAQRATPSSSSVSAARGLTPSPPWYPIVMASVLLLGLAYMVVYYLTSSGTDPHVPIMAGLHAWNFAIGFGVMLLGLVMAVRWR